MQLFLDHLADIPVGKNILLEDRFPDGWIILSYQEWGELINYLDDQGLLPLFYWLFAALGKLALLPDPVHQHTKKSYIKSWIRNQKYLKELRNITCSFNDAGIPIIALKGVCYAQTIYPEAGLRPMGDLDLLIPGSRISEAVRIAGKLGYVNDQPEVYKGLTRLIGDEYSLKRRDPPIAGLELHNSILDNKTFTYAAPVEWFWENSEPFPNNPHDHFENLFMLDPTAQLLYTGAHLILKHGGKSPLLLWFYDIDRMVRNYAERVNWDGLVSQASTFQWSSALDGALSKTQALFNTPIPEMVLEQLTQLNDRHRKWILISTDKTSTRVMEELRNLQVRNWYGKVLTMAGLIIPGPTYMAWRYQLDNLWKLPIAYLKRWWIISKDLFKTLIFHLGIGHRKIE